MNSMCEKFCLQLVLEAMRAGMLTNWIVAIYFNMLKVFQHQSLSNYMISSYFSQKFGGLEQLSAGMQGVLITTSDQEKLCVSEAYSLLNEVLTYSMIIM